jgi:hypothetical protein
VVGDFEDCAAGLRCDRDGDRPVAGVAPRILQKIADQAAQQRPVARHGDRLAGGIKVEACGLFGGQRQQVDRFAMLQRRQRFQAACQKDLLDQLVEFLDIALQRFASLGVGTFAQQRCGDGDAGEWRAQFVAAIGEQHAMGGDELLYTLG